MSDVSGVPSVASDAGVLVGQDPKDFLSYLGPADVFVCTSSSPIVFDLDDLYEVRVRDGGDGNSGVTADALGEHEISLQVLAAVSAELGWSAAWRIEDGRAIVSIAASAIDLVASTTPDFYLKLGEKGGLESLRATSISFEIDD